MPNASRNDPLGFAKRTLKNLEYVESTTDPDSTEPKVHLVTQIVNSMLGLVVFPHAAYLHPSSERLLKKLEGIRLDASHIADSWKITEDTYKEQCQTLGVLIWHIRNGASHRLVRFSCDSLDPRSVEVFVQDQRKKRASLWSDGRRRFEPISFIFFVEISLSFWRSSGVFLTFLSCG
jgi:HEPN pEK499 p136